jgi:DNA repair exonuclease SbcCD nuclease subunit
MTHPGDDTVLRLVHTSDWHLGCPFKQFRPHERARLQQARVAALEHVFGEAQRAEAHVVLCAGDLFDYHAPLERDWQALLRVLKNHAGSCPVVLLPGNHDPLVEGSVWRHRPFIDALPDFVHVVDRDDFELSLPEDARLFSRPTRSRMSSQDPILGLPGRALGDESIRIALVHGQSFQLGDQGANHPINPASAAVRGFDYVALGDTHGFQELTPGESYSVVYSGTPEQMRFGEHDAGHVAVVHIRRRSRRALVQKKPVATLKWHQETINSPEALDRLLAGDLHERVVSLTVKGVLDPETYREVQRKLDQMEGDDETPGLAVAAKIERALQLDDSRLEDVLAAAPPEIQEAARLLKERRNSPNHTQAVVDRAIARLLSITRQVTQ